MSSRDDLEDDSEDDLQNDLTKELFTCFGLAYYHSECLYRELCHTHALATFSDPKNVTRPRIEEKLAYAYSLTMGQLIEEMKNLVPKELSDKLDIGLTKRNFLAHSFWFEKNHLMFSIAGLNQLIGELKECSSFFNDLDEKVSNYFKPKMISVPSDMHEKALAEVISGKPDKPLPDRRKIKNRERVVKAWEFYLPDGKKPLVFETADGCLWELCDIGLGWSTCDQVGLDWKENEIIKKYLPASINPRPKDAKPWEYELELSEEVVLWVKPGKRDRTFKWGVRTKKE
ncbi:MAG: hypothetical protein PHN89_05240 [Candidatus Pacebacteria bacterium]|nr:hypothetical protein [Candidatus Paceibacterota bacterium]MDD5222465.1 hypothetical protein [bacterium]